MRKHSRKTVKKIKRAPAKAKKKLKEISPRFKPKKIQKKIRKLAKNIALHVSEFIATPAIPERSFHLNEERAAELPERYHENKAVLLVRDPWWLFAYWEVTPQKWEEVLQQISHSGQNQDRTVLRIYDLQTGSHFDIAVGEANNWYVDVGKPAGHWRAELGIATREGHFFVLVSFNTVKTPRHGVSDVLDEEWLLPDELYWKIFGLSSGFGQQKSSADLKEVLERYLKNIASSESSSNLSPGLKP